MSKVPYPGYMTQEQKELEHNILRGGRSVMLDTLDRIAYERGSQDRKWGEQDHTPAEWVSILGEEYGEVCNVVNQTIEPAVHVPLNSAHYEYELIQIAAVCVAAIECIRRQNGKPNASTTRATGVGKLRTDHR